MSVTAVVPAATGVEIDVTLSDDSNKPDLDAYMELEGFAFIGTDLPGSPLGVIQPTFFALDFKDPTGAAPPVSGIVAIGQDTVDNSLIVRSFVDNADAGIIFEFTAPRTAANLVLNPAIHADTAPGAVQTVRLAVYGRNFNAAFSGKVQLANFSIPTSTNWVVGTRSATLAALGITPGERAQVELIRDWNDVEDTLVGTLAMYSLEVGFS